MSTTLARTSTITNLASQHPLDDQERSIIHAMLNAYQEQLHDPYTDPYTLGKVGEQYTALRLTLNDWRLVDMNWHTRFGELDVIMLTPERILVFIEVKTRRSTHFGYPQEAVTAQKQLKLRKTAYQWLQQYGAHLPHQSIRFDVVAILASTNPKEPINFHHMQGALSW